MVQPDKGLEQKVIISAVTDYQDWVGGDLRIDLADLGDDGSSNIASGDFGDYITNAGGTNVTISNTDALGHLQQPKHYQDEIHPFIFNKDSGTGGRTGSSTRDLEFELDVNSITHSWNTSATPMDLWAGGVASNDTYQSDVMGEIIYQMNSYALDMGVFQEVITIRGVLIDRLISPHSGTVANSPAGAPHIMRQQLLDLARGQWAPVRGAGSVNDRTDSKSDFMNPNQWVALTIGPVAGRTMKNSSGDYTEDYWTAYEPHAGDLRGKERLRGANLNISGNAAANVESSHRRALTYNSDSHPYWMAGYDPGTNASDYFLGEDRVQDGDDWNVQRDWDYRLSYDGRTRYRGLISQLSMDNKAGRPDVWDYNFQFVCVKNEMMFRTDT